jgi:predicted RNA-binding protein YlxR (DUF448 family)
VRPRSEPERTCVGCRAKGSKAELVRVVRGPGGEVQIDATGKAKGRGVYVHRSEACIRQATRRGSLARALKALLGTAEAGRLVQQLLETVGDDR